MRAPARIRIDRLMLDGLPAGTTAAAIERAVRAALAGRLAGGTVPRSATIPGLRIDGQGRSVDSAAADVAGMVAATSGVRR